MTNIVWSINYDVPWKVTVATSCKNTYIICMCILSIKAVLNAVNVAAYSYMYM